MRATWSRRVRDDESGFTLIEMLVAAVVGILVTGAALSLVETIAKIAPKDQERAHAIRDAQVGLYRMTRELRQAQSVNGATPTLMDIDLTIGVVTKRVVYDCGGTRCLRSEAPVGAEPPSGGEVVVDRLLNDAGGDPVFTYSPAGALPPDHVAVSISVPASGGSENGHGHRVVFEDGLALRNVGLAR